MIKQELTAKEEDFLLEEWRELEWENKETQELSPEQEEYMIESGLERMRGLDED